VSHTTVVSQDFGDESIAAKIVGREGAELTPKGY